MDERTSDTYDEDSEDDYYISSFSKDLEQTVVLSPEQLDCQVRLRMSEHVERYLSLCSAVSGRLVPSCLYLRMISHCLPMRQILVGQSSYDERILPKYSSAFAFDYTVCKSWTPSSQVLAQAMSLYHGCDLGVSLAIVSNSYLLIPRGIVMLNVLPYTKAQDQAQAMYSSYLAELLGNIHYSSYVLGSRPLTQCEFGDEAKIAGDLFWASVRRMKLPLKRLSVRNPVWISRTYASCSVDKHKNSYYGPEPSDQTTKLYAQYGANHTRKESISYRRSLWNVYSKFSLSSIRPTRTLDLVSTVVKQESIESLESSFGKVISVMASTGIPNKDEEGSGYEQAVLKFVSEQASRHTRATEEMLKIMKDKSTSLRLTDRDQIDNLMECCRMAVSAASHASAFFASVPGTLSGDTSAVALGSTAVPPIVRATSFRSTAGDGRSGLTSGIRSKGEKDRKKRDKGKGREMPKGIALKPSIGPGPVSPKLKPGLSPGFHLPSGESVMSLAGDEYEVTVSPVSAPPPSHYGGSISEWEGGTLGSMQDVIEHPEEDFSGGADEYDLELIKAHSGVFGAKGIPPSIGRKKDFTQEKPREASEAGSVISVVDVSVVPRSDDNPIAVAPTHDDVEPLSNDTVKGSEASPFRPKSGKPLKIARASSASSPSEVRTK